MDNIYGWYPTKDFSKTIFEFWNEEKLVENDFIEDEDMIEEIHEIQWKIDDFYEKYLKDKPDRPWNVRGSI